MRSTALVISRLIFRTGFCELIPNQLLRPFDERELELVICGISNIDVNDWKQYTRLKHCTPETLQVVWFWQVRKSSNDLTNCSHYNVIQSSGGRVVCIGNARAAAAVRDGLIAGAAARVQGAARQHWSGDAEALHHPPDQRCPDSEFAKGSHVL